MIRIKIENELIIYSIGRDITKKKKDEQELKSAKDEQVKLNMELRAINHELVKQQKELKQTQNQLIQSEKMASLGVLSAGLAHEINNPLNYISSGIAGLKEHYNKLLKYIEKLNVLKSGHNIIALLAYINKNEESIKQAIEFTNTMFVHIAGGIEKTSEIIDSMRVFSARSKDSFAHLNINEVLDSVLVMLHNSYKNKATINKKYNDAAITKGNASKLYQVFMNIISNAIQAIPDKGIIWISTEISKNNKIIIIKIKDSGIGIPKKVQSKIFDPFFTTKKVGKGIGLGLYIAYTIIKQHKGNLILNSSTDKGTEFVVQLPILM